MALIIPRTLTAPDKNKTKKRNPSLPQDLSWLQRVRAVRAMNEHHILRIIPNEIDEHGQADVVDINDLAFRI